MSKLPILAGEDIIKILEKGFNFKFVSQKGSHVKLRKIIDNKSITTIVPKHKEVMTGTLKSVLELAKVAVEDFVNYYKNKF